MNHHRSGFAESSIRIEKLVFTRDQIGETSDGCPLAKWLIRRSGPHEKLLALVKNISPCEISIIAIVLWDAVHPIVGDLIYEKIVHKTTNFGIETKRGCSLNQS